MRDLTNSSHLFSSYSEQLCIHLFVFKNILGNYSKYAGLDIVYTHVNKHKHTKDEEKRKNQDEKKQARQQHGKETYWASISEPKRKKGKRQHSSKVAVVRLRSRLIPWPWPSVLADRLCRAILNIVNGTGTKDVFCFKTRVILDWLIAPLVFHNWPIKCLQRKQLPPISQP